MPKWNGKFKLITCILYRGGADRILKLLKEKGIETGNMHHARGAAIGDPVGRKGIPNQFEKEMLSVLVSEKTADEIFSLIFEAADFDRPYSGFMFMESVRAATPFQLPEVKG